jgi:hypothetical protein
VPLSSLFKAFWSLQCNPDSCRFSDLRFLLDGNRVYDQTAADCDLQDGDVIDVCMGLGGGYPDEDDVFSACATKQMARLRADVTRLRDAIRRTRDCGRDCGAAFGTGAPARIDREPSGVKSLTGAVRVRVT